MGEKRRCAPACCMSIFRIVCGTGFCYTFLRALAKKGKEMAEAAKQKKKKVYVETTVISNATALPFSSSGIEREE